MGYLLWAYVGLYDDHQISPEIILWYTHMIYSVFHFVLSYSLFTSQSVFFDMIIQWEHHRFTTLKNNNPINHSSYQRF